MVIINIRILVLLVLLLIGGPEVILPSKVVTTISNVDPTNLTISSIRISHMEIILHNKWVHEAMLAGSKGNMDLMVVMITMVGLVMHLMLQNLFILMHQVLHL